MMTMMALLNIKKLISRRGCGTLAGYAPQKPNQEIPLGSPFSSGGREFKAFYKGKFCATGSRKMKFSNSVDFLIIRRRGAGCRKLCPVLFCGTRNICRGYLTERGGQGMEKVDLNGRGV